MIKLKHILTEKKEFPADGLTVIAMHTDRNNHTDARLTLANVMGNKKFSMITSELYKLEIDLEKKYRRVIPQVSKISKDKMLERVIKVSKKDDVPGNPMKMKGEEKIKKLAWSGSVGMKKPGSYEIKGNKLNVNNIRPRDKGFFVRHFTMGTGFRKANLYYDGVHWQGKKKF